MPDAVFSKRQLESFDGWAVWINCTINDFLPWQCVWGGGTFQNKSIRLFLLPLAFELDCSLRKFPRAPEVQESSLLAGSDTSLSPEEGFAPRDNGVDRSVHQGLISAPQGPLHGQE